MQEIIAKRRVLLALTRELQVLGRAACPVSEETQADHPDIESRAILGRRNCLMRDYFMIRLDAFWHILVAVTPTLIRQLARIVPAS